MPEHRRQIPLRCKSSSVSSVRLNPSTNSSTVNKLTSANSNSKQQPSDRVVGEKVSFNDFGFKFKIDTKFVDQQTVSIKLNQSHSLLQGFVDDVPVTDKRDFKSQFLLTDGQLVLLFNLSSLLNSKSKKETVPFLSYFLPGKVDDDNSSYQVFLRFRFDRVQAQKQQIKQNQQGQNKPLKTLIQKDITTARSLIAEQVNTPKTKDIETDQLDQEDAELVTAIILNE